MAQGVPAPRHRLPSRPDRHAVRNGIAASDVTFIHPLALLGLVAAAIPALLHLLQRRVPPELDFPAVRYLSVAERESARRLKLRHLLLLVLRSALIIVIVLAAARPLMRVRGAGAHEPTALVVILDNSPSSGAVVNGRLVLDRLRVVAHSSISRTTSADRVWLMLADSVLRGGTREALLASLDSVKPAWQRLDVVQAVERAARRSCAGTRAGSRGAEPWHRGGPRHRRRRRRRAGRFDRRRGDNGAGPGHDLDWRGTRRARSR